MRDNIFLDCYEDIEKNACKQVSDDEYEKVLGDFYNLEPVKTLGFLMPKDTSLSKTDDKQNNEERKKAIRELQNNASSVLGGYIFSYFLAISFILSYFDGKEIWEKIPKLFFDFFEISMKTKLKS